MSKFRMKERELLNSIFKEEDVPPALGREILKTAERLAYEIQSPASRVKEYEDLISFHFKKKKGD